MCCYELQIKILCVCLITSAALLVGTYYFISDLLVNINNQVDLIRITRGLSDKLDIKIDECIKATEYYNELNSIDNSWFFSLSEQQKVDKLLLRNYLGVEEISDVNVATNKNRQMSL